MVCLIGIPRLAIQLAGVFLADEARTIARSSAFLAGNKNGGLAMPDLGAKKSAWTKTIALSR